ncbi:MAG: hypothetical protein OXT65_00700 [Alphaproteobacteria bacterium]|nr:hypothetical protein [Alphaproteobacteria bacterium]
MQQLHHIVIAILCVTVSTACQPKPAPMTATPKGPTYLFSKAVPTAQHAAIKALLESGKGERYVSARGFDCRRLTTQDSAWTACSPQGSDIWHIDATLFTQPHTPAR